MMATAAERPSRLPYAFAATCAAAALALYIFSGGLPKGPGRIHVRRIAWLALSTALSICLFGPKSKQKAPEPSGPVLRLPGGFRNRETFLGLAEVIPWSRLFVWEGYACDLHELKRFVAGCDERGQPLHFPYGAADVPCSAKQAARVRLAIAQYERDRIPDSVWERVAVRLGLGTSAPRAGRQS